MQKLIKISETHYIIVDDSEIKEGYFVYDLKDKVTRYVLKYLKDDYIRKITHSTQPLVHSNCCIAKEGITNMNKGCSERNRCLSDVLIIPLSEVEEAIYGYSVIILSNEHQKLEQETGRTIEGSLCSKYGFIEGFKTHQELTKDKQFTTEDMKKAILMAWDNSVDTKNIDEIIQSLLPKTEWDVTFDEQGKLKLI